MARQIIRRTPDIGLTVRLTPVDAAAPPAGDEPAIYQPYLGWDDGADWELEAEVGFASRVLVGGSTYWGLEDEAPIFGCRLSDHDPNEPIEWATTWADAYGGSDAPPTGTELVNHYVVHPDLASIYWTRGRCNPGVLEITATHKGVAYGPITLTLTDGYVG